MGVLHRFGADDPAQRHAWAIVRLGSIETSIRSEQSECRSRCRYRRRRDSLPTHQRLDQGPNLRIRCHGLPRTLRASGGQGLRDTFRHFAGGRYGKRAKTSAAESSTACQCRARYARWRQVSTECAESLFRHGPGRDATDRCDFVLTETPQASRVAKERAELGTQAPCEIVGKACPLDCVLNDLDAAHSWGRRSCWNTIAQPAFSTIP